MQPILFPLRSLTLLSSIVTNLALFFITAKRRSQLVAFRFCDSFLLFDLSHGFACAPALRNLVINQKPHF